MNFKSKFTAGCVIFALMGGVANSAELTSGAAACKSRMALQEYQSAVETGDTNTVDWLRSAACMVAPKNYNVQVLEETASGEIRFSATIQRRSATLWATANSVTP